MSLLYKPKEEQTVSVEIEVLKDNRVIIEFYSDCGKFGADEALCGYSLTAEMLMNILQNERNKHADNDL